MSRTNNKSKFLIVLVPVFVVFLLIVSFYFAYDQAAAASPTPSPAQEANPPPAQITDIVEILRRIIRLLAPAAGIAFLIMLLVGGYQFITSGGDPKAAGQARTTLTYAFIGVILVVAAWLILTVIASLTEVDVTNVTIPGSSPGPSPSSTP